MRFFAGDFWFDESDRTFNLWGDRQGSGVSRNATRNKESGVRYSSSRHGRHPRFQDFRWNCCKTTSSTPAFLIRTLVVLTNISIGRSKFGDRHWNSGVGLLPTRIGRPVFKRRPSGQDEVWSERADFSPLGTSGPLPCVEMPVIFRAVGSVADPSPVVEWRQLAEDVKELSSPLSIACCGVAPMGKFYKDWPCVLDVVATVQPLGNSNRLSRVHVVLGLGSCSRTRVRSQLANLANWPSLNSSHSRRRCSTAADPFGNTLPWFAGSRGRGFVPNSRGRCCCPPGTSC